MALAVVSQLPSRSGLSVLPALEHLLPHGVLPRGCVVSCQGVAAWSVALALVAGPSREGLWVGIAGASGLGLAAAAERGVSLERVVSVVEPPAAPFGAARWADLLAALIDGFDVVLLGTGVRCVNERQARRLQARAQHRGVVLVTVDTPAFGADLRLATEELEWSGLGEGHGVAMRRTVQVECSGRRAPRAQRGEVVLA
jgi:hypothetical protein